MAKAKRSKKSQRNAEEVDSDDSSSTNSSNSNFSGSVSSNKSFKMERKHDNNKQYKHKDSLKKKMKKEKHKLKKTKKKQKEASNLMKLSENDNSECERDVKLKNPLMDEKLIKSEKELQIKTECSKWESPQIKKRSMSRSSSRSRGRDYKSKTQRVGNRSQAPQSHSKHRQDNSSTRDKYQRRRDYNRNNDNVDDNKETKRERSQHSRSPIRLRDRSVERNNARRDNYSNRERYNKRRNDVDGRNSHDTKYEWGGGRVNKEERNRNTESKKNTKSDDASAVTNTKPDFGLSGVLAEDTNKVNGVVIKYSEPPEARKPKRRWRLYPFKGETALPVLHIHRQSCFLVGRDRKVVDLAVDHPSCSKQHAALQYRLVSFQRDDGTHGKRVRLYVIDLDSANGTFLNNKRIESRKYYELMEKDVIKFGFSTREYVLLHENSKEDQEDDDVKVKDEPID